MLRKNIKILAFLVVGLWVVLGTWVTVYHTPSPSNSPPKPKPRNMRAHVFYYCWYGNLQWDREFWHWKHRILPHWNAQVAQKFPNGTRTPPGDIGASYMPQRGFYSSADPKIAMEQFTELRDSGVNVIAVSWWGPKTRFNAQDAEGSASVMQFSF